MKHDGAWAKEIHYGAENLACFTPQTARRALDDTAYFELHPGEIPNPLALWLPGSLLVSDLAFDFLVKCFCSACPSFDYFDSQRLDGSQIDHLLHELEAFVAEMDDTPTRELLFARYMGVYPESAWSNVTTQDIATAVRGCTVEIIEFIKVHTKYTKCLWVIGM